jgi:PPP family 3-phenylpropionic acid transporter
MADRFVLRLSLFYGAFFVYAGLSMPFMPAWLAAKGLDAREIGIVLATPLVVRLVAVPLSTRLADRFGLLRQALVAVSIASVAAFVLIGLSSGFPIILAAFALAAMAISPVLPLADAYALRGLQGGAHRYGSVRLWGSVTFIIANLGGGLLLGRLGGQDVIWAVVAALGLTAGAALGLARLSPEAPGPSGMRPAGPSLWGSPLFIMVVIGASLIQASHAVMYGFATLQWSAKGIAGPAIGLLWGIGVVAEIVLFAVSARAVAALGAIPMIVLGGVGGVIRWAAMAFDPPTAALPFLQGLHALSFAATHLGSMHFLGRVAPAGRGATAQGDFAATQGIVFAAAMALSGVLVESYGSLAYGAMAAASAAGVMLAMVGHGLERKPPAA